MFSAISFESLSDVQKQATNAAIVALETSYSPYSHFAVGAALYTADGQIITASNYENASYPAGICAERSAIVRANAMNIRVFDGIAVTGQGENAKRNELVTPCGICRQVLYEVSQLSVKDLEIIMATPTKDRVVITTIKELLPYAFGPMDVGIDISDYVK